MKVIQFVSLQCGIPTQTNNTNAMTTQSSTAAHDSTMLATTDEMDIKECDTTITSVLGAVVFVLVTLQAVTLTGWTVSCCVIKRQQSTRLKPRYTYTYHLHNSMLIVLLSLRKLG